MRSRQGPAVAFVVASSLVLTACGGDSGGDGDGGSDAEPYRIMLSAGEEASFGSDMLVTGNVCAEAAVDVVNEDGGINGRQIELIQSPDNADPAAALTALNEQIAEQKPDAYLVSSGSGVSAAVAEALDRNDIIFADSANIPATNDPENNPYAFHLAAPQSAIAESFAVELEEQGYESVAILRGNSAYAKLFGEEVESVLTEQGFDVVSAVEYDSAALDLTAPVGEVQASDPDVLILNGYGAPVGYALDAIQKVGWDVPVLGDTSVTASPLVTTEPPDGLLGTPAEENLRIQVTQSLVPSVAGETVAEAVEQMKATGELRSSLTNCQNYDAVILIAAMGNAAESTDPADMIEQLYDPEVTGPDSGTAIYAERTYSEDNHSPQVPADTHIFVEPAPVVDGQLVEAGS
jgi:branched-chain amino acid transport system substrate-binding protein